MENVSTEKLAEMEIDTSESNSNINKIISKSKKNRKKTPYSKLKRHVMNEINKKKLIGDITINDSAFEILMEYFKKKCNLIENSNTHIVKDIMFAVALVQIGIRYYDGNFWKHVANILGKKKLNTNFQAWIGDSFVYTLMSYNKVILDKHDKVNNILMHGFVSDHYADEMFDFLFKYYNIDLERDLQRNDKEMMNNLIEVIQRTDNSERTYLLVRQTANAIKVNIRGGKIRIRNLLKLIDKCFWENIIPVNPVSRLSILFNKWQESSDEFKLEYSKYNCLSDNSYRKKSYSSPYIKCYFNDNKFKLILPAQLIKFEYKNDVKWKIYTQSHQFTEDAYLYEAVTGYKTEGRELDIKNEDIFNEFKIELDCNEKCIRFFKLKGDCIRFFDRDGNLLNSDNNLQSGQVYAFTRENEYVLSEALILNEPAGNLVRNYFELEKGDIVRLPDGKTISIGKKIEEGLMQRKMLKDAYAKIDDEVIPIYREPPILLIKMQKKRAIGTVIQVNNKKYRMFDEKAIMVNLNDRSKEVGYIINLKNYSCKDDGIYTIMVDVPNDKTKRFWKFILVNGITYEFQDSPYVFKSRGTINFNEALKIDAKDSNISKNCDENSFNFEVNPKNDYIEFIYEMKKQSVNLYFYVPVLKWSFNKDKWNIEKPMDIWYSDFPSYIYFKYPTDKLTLSLDEKINYEDLQEQSVTYLKSKSKGIFICDVTRFKSWFGREKIKRCIFIDIKKTRIEFLSIITRSLVADHTIRGDFKLNKLIGEFDIIGKANYYADIKYLEANETLQEKLLLNDGKFAIDSTLINGRYEVALYEEEEDDTGFGVSEYSFLNSFVYTMVNPYDLTGRSILIKSIKKSESSTYQRRLSCNYIIYGLKRVKNSDDNNYSGNMIINSFHDSPINYKVNVKFYNLDRLQYAYITYYDGYDYIEFLFDTYKCIIVKEEEKGLKRAVKYRRYESIYPEDYVYVVEFIDFVPEKN